MGWKAEDYDSWASAAARRRGRVHPAEQVGRRDRRPVRVPAPRHQHGPGPRGPGADRVMADLLSLFPAGSALDDDGTLVVGGCRADDLAEEFGTPVLVVAEQALRARAREYVDELAARWANSRVVFASKAFPCTAVQRVMVEEGLGLDVAGGGEILTAVKAGVDPGADRAARQREERRGDRHRGRARRRPGRGRQRRRRRPARGDGSGRPHPGRAGADHPGRHRRHARARAHRPRGLEVRARPRRRGAADQAHRAQPAAADAGPARARGLADPRRRAVRRVGGTGRAARRVPDLRPRRRPRAPATPGPTSRRPWPPTSTP